MEEYEVMCDDYGWIGDATEMVSDTSRVDAPCILCPECGSDEIYGLK